MSIHGTALTAGSTGKAQGWFDFDFIFPVSPVVNNATITEASDIDRTHDR
jgi:hypothetical protein